MGPLIHPKAAAPMFSARNQWRHLASDIQDKSTDTPVQIEQDANLFVAEMDDGQTLDFQLKENRMAYALCVEGSVKLQDGNGEVVLQRHDGCEIKPDEKDGKLTFEAIGSEKVEDGSELAAHVLVFEMANVEGSGRKDL